MRKCVGFWLYVLDCGKVCMCICGMEWRGFEVGSMVCEVGGQAGRMDEESEN